MNNSSARRYAPLALISAFVCVLLYPFVLRGRALYWGDLYLYFHPMQEFVRQNLLDGLIPLWNPYVYCGQPLVGNPQSWVFYPGSLLLVLMPVWLFFTVNAVLHLAAGAWGAYLFFRRVCHDRSGALLGALVYSGSGYVIARLQFPNMAQSTAFLPWLLLLVDRTIAKPGVGYSGLTALAVCLCILAGHAQIAYMTLLCTALYAIARIFQFRRHRIRVGRAVGWLSVSAVIGVTTSSVQLIPVLQLFGHSTREQLRWFEATRFILKPEQLVNFVAPNYYGHSANGDYWGAGNLMETCVFVGILPVCLALYAFTTKPGRPAVAFFALIGVASLLLAMGEWGGLFWVAYYIVPGISSFHDPARFGFITTFAMAALAAIGMRLLRERAVHPRIRFSIAALAAVNLMYFSSGLNPGVNPIALVDTPRPTLAGGRVYAYNNKDLWERFVNYADYGPQTEGYTALLSSSMAPNSLMRFGIPAAGGYEPVPIRNMTEVDRLVRESFWQSHQRLDGLLKLMNVGVVSHSVDLKFGEERSIHGPGWRSWRTEVKGPPMWFVNDVVSARDAEDALGTLSLPAFDPSESAVLEGLPEEFESQFSSEFGASVLNYSRDSLTATVRAGLSKRVLVRSAAFYPGWEAEIDGKAAPILRVNHAFQAVVVPAGEHELRFRFRPHAYRVGLFVTLASLTAMSFMVTLGWIIRRNRFPDVRP